MPRLRTAALERRSWHFAWAFLFFSFSPLCFSQDDANDARTQLQTLEKEIERINWEINAASAKRSAVQEKLRAADVELGRVQRNITDNQKSITDNEAKLVSLQSKQENLADAAQQQKERIATEMKTAWQMGRESQLKMLLSQEDPEKVARSMEYYRYFFAARNKLLEEYRDTLKELESVRQAIDSTLETLTHHRENLAKEEIALVGAKKEQQLAVANLSASISSKAAELKKKQANRKELGKLLSAIEEAIVQLELPQNYQAFSKAKGEMPWPISGKRSNRFGRPRNEGKMRWQGINIRAREGTTVNAIHHGRVVYADWFRGSGLLLIVDHGDGYMSLYAHNQALLKDVGEWVTAGTPISTVGNSGGLERSALYFEIRYKGKPTDPAKWCKG